MQKSVPERRHPGSDASPVAQPPITPQLSFSPHHAQQQQQQTSEQLDFSSLDFPTAFSSDQSYLDSSFVDASVFATSVDTSRPQTCAPSVAPAPSTDLVRRARNQQLAPAKAQQEAWASASLGTMNGKTEEEDEQDLDMRVAIAKREAQGKRKQIPPFVQKLSSFLDKDENKNLIRWSDDGRSFIVLDEDEFARTLIPELFKHNNYASFVRQLNMYGFHKTVNITDGSLRQSEQARKGQKPPSMYSHPYFRRNRPDLLWLIQKPTAKSATKRKRDGTVKGEVFDSDDERYSPGPESRPPGELGAAGAQGVTQIPRSELAAVRQELKKLQQQQGLISRMISQLKEQNEQFYRQAMAFQALHDRHENSINAILTFLATFYNRSLEAHAGQNLVNVFSDQGQSNQQQQQQQQHGSVLEEFQDSTGGTKTHKVRRYNKRPQLLLDAPDASKTTQKGDAVTEPNGIRPASSPPNDISPRPPRDSPRGLSSQSTNTQPVAGSPVIKDDAGTLNVLSQVPENEEMMSLINNANATNAASDSTPAFDLSALQNYPTASGLTLQQRTNMLAMINQHGGSAATSNNALISPTPPPLPQHMDNIRQNQEQIDRLVEMQKQQDERTQQLTERLTAYSPGASLTTGDESGNFFDAVTGNNNATNAEWDMDDILHDMNGDDPDIDFNFGNTTQMDAAGFNYDPFAGPPGDVGVDIFASGDSQGVQRDYIPDPIGTVASISSESTSPTVTNPVAEDEAEMDPGTPQKRLRVS